MSHRLAILILTVLTLAAFAEVRHHDFVNWDDQQNLIDNTAYQGWSSESLAWMFTTTHGGHYQPFTWLSWSVDHALWGLNPAGFHLTNLVLHILTAIALYVVTLQLIRPRQINSPEASASTESTTDNQSVAAFCGAAFFAIHPLRVESVAWVTERRDVLAGFLLVLSTAFYLHYVRPADGTRRTGWLVISLCTFVASLLSKASGMVLPAILLALDAYPLRRFAAQQGESRVQRYRSLLMEKVPYLLLAIGSAVLAAKAQREAGAMWSLEDHPLALRIAQAFQGLAFYPFKTLIPWPLSPLYEQDPQASIFDWPNIVGFIVVSTMTFLAYRYRLKYPAVSMAWFCYVILVAPTIGLVQSGPQLVADRYSYFSCMPFAVLLSGLVMSRLSGPADPPQLANRRSGTLTGGLALAIILVLATRQQVAIWESSKTLWAAVLERGTSTGIANANMASLLNQEGAHDLACQHADAALKTLPGNRTAHFAKARCSYAIEEFDTSIHHYQVCREIDTHLGRQDRSVLFGLASANGAIGQYEAADDYYEKLIALDPVNPAWPYYWSGLLASAGRPDDAIDQLQSSLGVDPSFEPAYTRLAQMYANRGDTSRAMETLTEALRRSPQSWAIKFELASLLVLTGDETLRNEQRASSLIEPQLHQDLTGISPVRRLELLAAFHASRSEFDEAIAITSQAMTLCEQTHGRSTTFARLTEQRDHYARAERWFLNMETSP
ncbi:MAG: tetratricopeptide repeat protein [Phycisphaerae bacterium]